MKVVGVNHEAFDKENDREQMADDAQPRTVEQVLELIDAAWAYAGAALDDRRLYYRAPDSAEPIPDAIWQRLDPEAVEAALATMNANLRRVNGARKADTTSGEPDASTEFAITFSISQQERDLLAETAGSSVLREVVTLLSEAEEVNAPRQGAADAESAQNPPDA